MRVNIVRTTIAEQLAPLFARARAEGLYFHGHYQNMWFSPDELEALQAQGEFRWGAVNWELRDPAEHTRELERRAEWAQSALDAWREKIGEPEGGTQ